MYLDIDQNSPKRLPYGAARAKPVVPPCSSAESAEAYPPTHKASEGYPPRIHSRPWAVVFRVSG